ncbi:MAG: hypothetical protein QOJ80_4092 [Mycobacterium sp.]|nr:hypothetical protein [Mycobacterium sp.]
MDLARRAFIELKVWVSPVTHSWPPSSASSSDRGTSLDLHADRPGNEVGVFLDQLPDLPLSGVVVQLVLGVFGLEIQRDNSSLRGVVDGLDGVGALPAGNPTGGSAFAGLEGE